MQDTRFDVFLAVAMSKNFAKAAAILNVTPSSISKGLKNLECEMGLLLVDRQKGLKTVRLTPAGEALLPLVLKWQEAVNDISEMHMSSHAHFLSVAGCETANNGLLPPVFKKMLNHAPPIHLEITSDPTDMLYEKVETRDVDVAFVVHQEASKIVRITPIYRDEMLVVRCEESASEDRSVGSLTSDELGPADEMYIEWSQDFKLWHQSAWDPSIPTAASLLSAYIIPNMIDSPGKWSIVPSCVVRDFRNMNRRLRFHRLTPSPPVLTYYKVTHRAPKLSAIGGLKILDKILREENFQRPWLHYFDELKNVNFY